MAGKRVIPPSKQNIKGISDKISVPENPDTLSVSFSKFKLDPICLRGKFNNHFKDNQQYISIVTSLLSVVLPKITSHSYGEVCEGSNEGRQLHFHTIDDKHRKIVREILKEYNFSKIHKVFLNHYSEKIVKSSIKSRWKNFIDIYKI